MNIAIALMLLAFGVYVTVTLFRSLAAPFLKNLDLHQYLFNKNLKNEEETFQNACKAFGEGDIEDGFNLIAESFHFGYSRKDLKFLDKLARYNFSVIDRLSEILSDDDTPHEGIILLEGLFQSRTEILKALAEKRSDAASYAYNELIDRCQTNERTIRAHLKTIALSLTKKPSEHASYH